MIDLFQGTHYEIGVQIGRKYHKVIRNYLRCGNLGKTAILDAYYSMVSVYFPQYLEELIGIAHGAHISFTRLFNQVCCEDQSITNGGCTDIITESFVIHTNDELQQLGKDIVIYCIKAPNEPEIICFTTGCIHIQCAINSMGVCFTGNALVGNDCQTKGVPKYIFYRAVTALGSIKSIINLCKKVPRASADNINVSTAKERLNIECSATDLRVHHISEPYIHTNHFIDPHLRQYEASPTLKESTDRLRRAEYLLHKCKDHLTAKSLRSIITDHGYTTHGSSGAICRHGKIATIFAIIINLKTGRITYFDGYPCEGRLLSYRTNFI